jgi:hypothetical protein
MAESIQNGETATGLQRAVDPVSDPGAGNEIAYEVVMYGDWGCAP